MALPQRPQIQKHNKYIPSYKPFDYYWGLGIEHETYLATTKTASFTTFKDALQPERYSVSYYKSYKQLPLAEALANIINDLSGEPLQVPILVNSHSFTHCDKFNNHKTTYSKKPVPNPAFKGKTLFEWISIGSDWMRNNYERTFCFDGDSFEFMTQNFYKANAESVLKELEDIESQFNKELARIPREGVIAAYGPFKIISPLNPPFAVHLTNLKNVAMFNNGTIHINITLPTRLGRTPDPLFWTSFLKDHQRLARLVQWLEPLWIACYCAPDPFPPGIGAKGSQRMGVSRYIGIGTFDTGAMQRGKILQVERSSLGPMPWYDTIYSRTQYEPLDVIGMDINFNKHGAHGLELRFLDQMPMSDLRDVLHQVCIVAARSLQLDGRAFPVDPRRNQIWHRMAAKGVCDGRAWCVEPEEGAALMKVFGFTSTTLESKEPIPVYDFLQEFVRQMPRGHALKYFFGSPESRKGCFDCLKIK